MVFVISAQPSFWTWLGPLLTFCGSLLLFSASMFGVWWTNRKADSRETNAWRRDTVLELCSAVSAEAHGLEMSASKAMQLPSIPTRREASEVRERVRRLEPIVINLHIIGAEELSQKCSQLHAAMADLAEAAGFMRDVHTKQDESEAAEQDLPHRHAAGANLNTQFTNVSLFRALFMAEAQKTLGEIGINDERAHPRWPLRR
jgi:hypothetical protein